MYSLFIAATGNESQKAKAAGKPVWSGKGKNISSLTDEQACGSSERKQEKRRAEAAERKRIDMLLRKVKKD